MDATVYNQEGRETGKVKIPEAVFGLPWNGDLVHQAMTSMRSNERVIYAHVKDRGEVSGGGKKPWQQKGTGRARHGSIRSPIWVGGGVSHGPNKAKNYSRKINKKMKTKALFTVLSKKLADHEVIFVDRIALPTAKTIEAKKVLVNLAVGTGYKKIVSKKQNSAIIAMPVRNQNILRGFNNFNNVSVGDVRNINLLDVLNHTYTIIVSPEESFAILTNKTQNAKRKIKN